MASSIYNVTAWQNNKFYKKNDIVSTSEGLYYYSKEEHTSHPSQTFAQTRSSYPTLWDGVGNDNIFGIQRSSFFWRPSYTSNVESTPAVRRIQFGGGYEQRVEDGINSILLQFNLRFDERDLDETTAIIHFFHTKRSVDSFLYVPGPPYNTQGRYVCRSWSLITNFYNNYAIAAKFDQVAE